MHGHRPAVAERMNAPIPADAPGARRLRLGRCTLDLDAGELLDAQGEIGTLRRQALALLLVLGRRAGQVVGKDELMAEVWPRVVVGEGSLTQAIAEVRRALGDDDHRLVRTVARRGYRLVPDGEAAPGDAAETLPQDGPAAADGPSGLAPPPGPAAAAPMATGPAARLGAALLALLVVTVALLALRHAAPLWQTPADLARTPLPREAPALSVVVLPLALENESAGNAWMAEALHGDLVTAIARQAGAHVVARDTAATYRGREVDPRAVARELGVRHVVRGSLRQEGGVVHLNLGLVDGDSGVQRWADTFAIDRAQLAQAVGDFAVAVERTLTPALVTSTAERRAAVLSPTEVTADDLAMQGFALWARGVSRDNVLAARELFEQALRLDPDSLRAWQGLQFTTANQLLNGWTDDPAATVRRTEDVATQLERLDPEGSQTYSAKAFRLFRLRDFPALLGVTTAWTERYRLPLAFGAHGAALIANGRFDEAVPVLERALRLGPRDPFRAEWQYRLALAHFGAGRYELARQWSRSAADTNARLVWPPLHAAALLRMGRRDEAQQAFDEHRRRHPDFRAAQVRTRVPSDEPRNAELRERLVASLRELGMKD